MSFDSECIEIHRQKFQEGCDNCSVMHNFSLQTIQGIDSIAGMITFAMLENTAWKEHEEKVKFIVRFALYETCLNAIEHGVLGLGDADKKKLKLDMASRYEDHIESEWQAKGKNIDITCCVHFKRVLIGVHDDGDGFKFDKKNFVRIPETDLLETSGRRGLSMLRKMGFALYFNEAGNTVLCSFRNPSYRNRRCEDDRRTSDRRGKNNGAPDKRKNHRRTELRRVRKSL